jgi:hypothetical protein
MKIQTIDSKKRLVLSGAKPGEAYAVSQTGSGHYELTKVVPSQKPKPTPAELDAMLDAAPLEPKMSWQELRALTREP